MPRPRFIVCESTSRWTVAMRWGLADRKVQVHQTTSLDGCLATLADAAGSVVALEVAMFGVEAALRSIRDLRETFPGSPVIALVDSDCPYEAILREAGAAHVLASRREIPAAARFVKRCLDKAEVQPESYRDRVWSRMPWGNHIALRAAAE
jgi:hypothetical protein